VSGRLARVHAGEVCPPALVPPRPVESERLSSPRRREPAEKPVPQNARLPTVRNRDAECPCHDRTGRRLRLMVECQCLTQRPPMMTAGDPRIGGAVGDQNLESRLGSAASVRVRRLKQCRMSMCDPKAFRPDGAWGWNGGVGVYRHGGPWASDGSVAAVIPARPHRGGLRRRPRTGARAKGGPNRATCRYQELTPARSKAAETAAVHGSGARPLECGARHRFGFGRGGGA
jgi:hypothetical protein